MSKTSVLNATHIGSEVPWEDAVPHIRARLYKKLVSGPNGCLLWTGSKVTDGYGELVVRAKRWRAHVLAWTLENGPKPDGLIICHTCDTPACCNPRHLYAGTKSQNKQDEIARGLNYEKNRTHCPKGHPYDEENTSDWTDKGWRNCKTCTRARMRIAAGWPTDLAYSLPPTPKGQRPVNGKFPRRGQSRHEGSLK